MDRDNPADDSQSSGGWNGDSVSGIRKLGAGMVGSFLDYVFLRLTLLGIEAREAKSACLGGFLFFGGGIFLLAIGWLLLWIGLIAIISRNSGTFWGTVTLWAALGHLVFASLLIWLGRSKFAKANLFEDTAAEFQKDREWLEKNRPVRR